MSRFLPGLKCPIPLFRAVFSSLSLFSPISLLSMANSPPDKTPCWTEQGTPSSEWKEQDSASPKGQSCCQPVAQFSKNFQEFGLSWGTEIWPDFIQKVEENSPWSKTGSAGSRRELLPYCRSHRSPFGPRKSTYAPGKSDTGKISLEYRISL